MPEGLLYVGQSAFRNTKLNEVEIPLSVEYVENWAFMNCEELESITVLGNTQFEWTALPDKKNSEKLIIKGKKNSPIEDCFLKHSRNSGWLFEEVCG